MRPPDSLPNQTLERRTRSVIYGNEIQPSLRDVACLRCAPNAEALGYCHPVPPGRDPRGVSSWIQPRSGQTNAPLLSRQCGNSFVTQPWCDGEWAYPDTTTRNFLPLPARNERGGKYRPPNGKKASWTTFAAKPGVETALKTCATMWLPFRSSPTRRFGTGFQHSCWPSLRIPMNPISLPSILLLSSRPTRGQDFRSSRRMNLRRSFH